MSESKSSSSRRLVLLGILVASGALFYSVLQRRDEPSRSATRGDFGICSTQTGAAARTCYRREVGLELAAVGGAPPSLTFVTSSESASEVTFTSADVETRQQDLLLCDLHARVGVTDERIPSWLAWTEPLASAAPAS